ncbi:MAG: CBS domain-containing protein [Desulfobacterales bacterium]|nr:MAG: CBS domain-containing protein [Desulfobacterales bacterium]
MLVRNWMHHPPVTVRADDALQKAIELLTKHEIHILPVVENDRVTGVITDSDIKRASISEVFSLEDPELAKSIARIKVKAIMNKKPVTVAEDHTIEEAAALLFVHDISGAPVVNQAGELVGVITKNDIFRVVISLTGIKKKGIQFGLKLKDRPGAIKEITDLIREYGGRIASILSTGQDDEETYLNVYLRVYGLDLQNRGRLKEVLSHKAELLYIVDHEENTRKIY